MSKYIQLTGGIDTFNEPKAKLRAIQKNLKPYYGKTVFCYGGGGYPGSEVTLDRVTLHPTIMRGGEGFTLKAWLSGCESRLASYNTPGKFSPWLGSWQLAAEATK